MRDTGSSFNPAGSFREISTPPGGANADVAVIPSPDEEAGELPKAFVVLKREAGEAEIMSYVAEQVAPHKKVRRLEFCDEIPKSPTGKILRRILVEQERAEVATSN